jgi:hypothetical protein
MLSQVYKLARTYDGQFDVVNEPVYVPTAPREIHSTSELTSRKRKPATGVPEPYAKSTEGP